MYKKLYVVIYQTPLSSKISMQIVKNCLLGQESQGRRWGGGGGEGWRESDYHLHLSISRCVTGWKIGPKPF